MNTSFKRLPDKPTVALLALLCVGSWAALYAEAAQGPYRMPLLALLALAAVALAYWAGWRAHLFHQKMERIVDDMQEDRKQLQHQIAMGNSDLQTQRSMLLAFQSPNHQQELVGQAARLLDVGHASFWVLDPVAGLMHCRQAFGPAKHPIERGTVWKQEQFPILFQRLQDGEAIAYPEGPSHRDYRPPIGNLLHYIENSQVKSLFVMPIGATNGVLGVVWFEDRQQELAWSERMRQKAHFVAGALHLALVQELQAGLVSELSAGLSKLEVLRDYTPEGWAWYVPQSVCRTDQPAELLLASLAKSQPHDHNPQFAALAPPSGAELLGKLLPQEAMAKFLEQRFRLAGHEWEVQGEWYSTSMLGIPDGGVLRGLWVSMQRITDRKRREHDHEHLLAHLSNVVVEVDGENRIVSDRGALGLLGYAPGERLDHGIASYLHHQDQETLELALWKARQHGQQVPCAGMRVRKHLGGYVLFDARVYAGQENGHVVVEFIEASMREAEKAEWLESQAFLKRLLAHSHEAVCVIDEGQRLTYVSENLPQLFGHAAADRMGRYALEYFHQQDTPALIQALERIQAGGLLQHQQTAHFLHGNGKWVRVQAALHAMSVPGRPIQVALRLEQAGEALQEADRLRNREQLLADVLGRSNRAFLLLGEQGIVRYAAGDTAGVLGFSGAELVGKPLQPLVKPEEKQAFEQNWNSWKADPKGRYTAFFNMKQKDGTWKALAVSSWGALRHEAYAGLLVVLERPLASQPTEAPADLKADFFEGVANSLPLPFCFMDKAWEIKFANAALRGWLGFAPGGHLGGWADPKTLAKAEAAAKGRDAGEFPGRFKDAKGQYWQAPGRLLPLEGSVVQGYLLLLAPPSKEAQELEQALADAQQAGKRLEQDRQRLERELEQVRKESAWMQEQRAKEAASLRQQLEDASGGAKGQLQEQQRRHEAALAHLDRRIDLLQELLAEKNAAIASLEARMGMLADLRAQGQALQRYFGDLRELLQLVDEAGPQADWAAKWEEIQHFKQIIQYDQAMREVRAFLSDLQQVLDSIGTADASAS